MDGAATTNDPFDLLVGEHVRIVEALDLLDALVDAHAAGIDVGSALDTLLRFFARFLDAAHHGKEERALFPALAAAGLPRSHGPLVVMQAEHDRGRELVAALRFRNDAGFPHAAREFSRLLRGHIDKENKVLFEMGRRLIPALRRAELLSACLAVEAEVLGEGEKRALEASLQQLRARSPHASFSAA